MFLMISISVSRRSKYSCGSCFFRFAAKAPAMAFMRRSRPSRVTFAK